MYYFSFHKGGSKVPKKQSSGNTTNTANSSVSEINREQEENSDGSERDYGDDDLTKNDEDLLDDDDDIGLDIGIGNNGGKQVRETERRYANNARERWASVPG